MRERDPSGPENLPEGMRDYDPAEHADLVAWEYDALNPPDSLETANATAELAALARRVQPGSVLELGIGTGRLALELKRLGLDVAGIDCSEKMISQLRSKPGGADIEVTYGDYCTTSVPGPFSVVALMFNTIFDPRGLEAQLDVFRNAAKHLVAGGFFVVEGLVLREEQRTGKWSVERTWLKDEHLKLHCVRYDIFTNRMERIRMHLRPSGIDAISTATEAYAAPGELDVMAAAAGFERVDRFAGWGREPFTQRSTWHVSIYELGC